jgi:hypothetical protein
MLQSDAILHFQEEVEIVQPTTAFSDVVVSLFLHLETAEERNKAMEYELMRHFNSQEKDVNFCLTFEIASRKVLSLHTFEHQQKLMSLEQTADRRILALTEVNDDDTLHSHTLNHIAAIRRELCLESDLLRKAFTFHEKKLYVALHRFLRDVVMMYRRIQLH